MTESLFRICLSIQVTSVVGEVGFSPCFLPLRSRQIVWTIIWKLYRSRNVLILSLWPAEMIFTTSCQFVEKWRWSSGRASVDQISYEYLQLKNRWSRVSCWWLHKTQVGITPAVHPIIRSAVESLFFIASHVQKAYFGVACVNQTALVQETFPVAVRVLFHVSFVENDDRYMFPLPFHRDESILSVSLPLFFCSSSSSIQLRWSTRWCRLLRVVQASARVESIPIPRSITPRRPVISSRLPSRDQLSNQKEVEEPSPTSVLQNSFACALYFRSFLHIHEPETEFSRRDQNDAFLIK